MYLLKFDSKFVSVVWGSLRATVFFNTTVPADLIGVEISVIWKYFKQSDNSYPSCSNGTHYTVRMKFHHTAAVEHFEIHGTEGINYEVRIRLRLIIDVSTKTSIEFLKLGFIKFK
jgi:hypothetical protein